MSASWKACSSRQAADRVGAVEEQRARARTPRTSLERHPRLAARRPASATASSTSACAASARAPARASAATRAISAGSTPASSRVSNGAWMPSNASALLASRRASVVDVVELEVARVRVEARRLARQLDVAAAATRRARGSRAAAPAAAARASVVERTRTCWPGSPRGSSRPAARRSGAGSRDSATAASARASWTSLTAPPRRGTTRRSARAARRGRSGARRGVAARQRASSSRWPSVGTPGISQLHREPLEQELDARAARRPPATAGCRRATSRVLARASPASDAPRSSSTLLAVRRLVPSAGGSCGAAAPLRGAVRPPAHYRSRTPPLEQLARDVAAQRVGVAAARRPPARARRACGSTRAPARCPG